VRDDYEIVPRNKPAPLVCFKCGARSAVSHVERHFYVTPDSNTAEDIAGIAGNLAPALGAAGSVVTLARLIRETREANVGIALCASCTARWSNARVVRAFSYAPAVVAALAVTTYGILKGGPLVPGGTATKAVFVVGFTVVAYALVVLLPKLIERSFAEARTCGVVAIAPEWIALTRIHPHARAALVSANAPDARELLGLTDAR
jgi:hypothetical protein